VSGRSPPPSPPRPAGWWSPWLAAAALFAGVAYLFYPGALTWDSGYQWYQVRTGQWDSVHPVIMTALWSLTDRALPGPGGYFLLQLAAYWSGLAALATGLFARPRAQLLTVLGLGLFLPVLALLPFLWKDIGLLAGLVWTCALLVREQRRPRRMLRGAAFATLVLACAFRHNALPLAVPLLWYLAGREPALQPWRRRIAATAALTLVLAVLAGLPNRWPGVEQRSVWPLVATWDLARVSVAERTVLLPPEILAEDFGLADLDRHVVAHSAVPMFGSGKIADSISKSLTAEQSAALVHAWLTMLREHLPAYLAHRARVTALLLGLDQAALPNQMILEYGVIQVGDNPALPVRNVPSPATWNRLLHPLLDSPVFAFWPYGLVLLVLAVGARARRPVNPLLLPLLVSAALLVLPLALVAPSVEFRYLLWAVFAAPLGLALHLSPPAVATEPQPAP
jgi:hypothetical protein